MSSRTTAHYDNVARNTVTKKARKQLRTYPIREFNNLVKRSMLSYICNRPDFPPGCRVLDVCCGRGGDIFKYNAIAPSFVHFVDVSTDSINEAVRRFNTGKKNIDYEAKFGIADCFSDELEKLLGDSDPFDVIVCHFALHYAFESREKFTTLMNTLTKYMKPDAYFLATFPNATTIRDNCGFEISTQLSNFNNGIMSIQPLTIRGAGHPETNSFGQEYLFSLEDAVTNCPEYLVCTKLFEHYLAYYNIDTIIYDGFHESVSSLGIDPDKIPAGVDDDPFNPLRAANWQVVDLYNVFIGQKGINVAPAPKVFTNYRGLVQEHCQKLGCDLPRFNEYPVEANLWVSEGRVGPTFSKLDDTVFISNPQATKKEAQQQAASFMLLYLEKQTSCVVEDCLKEDTAEVNEMLRQTIPENGPIDMFVHIDADHISFVGLSITRVYPSVHFIFNCGYGSELGHLREFTSTPQRNVEIRKATEPLRNLADSMILVSAAQLSILRPKIPHVVVSRDATVYHAQKLIPYSKCVTTLEDLTQLLESDWGGLRSEFPSTPKWSWS